MDIKLKNNLFQHERELQIIYRKLFFQMAVTAIIYTVFGTIAYLVIINLIKQFDVFYSIVNWIERNRIIGFFAYIGIGYTIILIYYWKKPFHYLNSILIATSSIYQQDDKMIILPNPLKTIENYLNELRLEVQESKIVVRNTEQRKNDMIAYLAHDLKTPLTFIIGYLSLLNDAPDMAMEQRKRCITISIEKAQRLEKMINEFFDISESSYQLLYC